MIVVGVIFPHHTRFVTFSLSKAIKKERKKKALQYLRERPAVVGVWTPHQQLLNFWTADWDYLFYLCSFVWGLWDTRPDTHAWGKHPRNTRSYLCGQLTVSKRVGWSGASSVLWLKEGLTDGRSGIRAPGDKGSVVQTHFFPVFTPKENGRTQIEIKETEFWDVSATWVSIPQKVFCFFEDKTNVCKEKWTVGSSNTLTQKRQFDNSGMREGNTKRRQKSPQSR